MKNKKLITYIVILSLSVLTVITITPITKVSAAAFSADVNIDTSVLEDDVLYYNYVTVKFEIENVAQGWLYSGSYIYLSGVQVASTSNRSFEKGYYPEAYVGNHSLKVVAHFINFQLETEEEQSIAYFNVITCINRTDIEDLRIDKLHEYETSKTWLDGSGITICIADDYLGAHEDLDGIHKSVIRSGKNDIYGNEDRKFIDIEYYEYNSNTSTFEEDWDATTREGKWNELFTENKANYNFSHDIHGIYTLSTLRQIAPGATFKFIETRSDYTRQLAAIDFILENNASLDVDIFCFSYTVNTASYETKFDSLEDLGIITVNAAGNSGETYNTLASANKPCSYNNSIGVTGVYDGDYSISADRWKLDSSSTNGYGIDIACISDRTALDWEPVPDLDYFNGTSNSCPVVAGTIALLKQYRNSYKSNSDFTTSDIHILFEETGDEYGTAPRLQSSGINGSYDHVNENGTYTTFPYYTATGDFYETYAYGWGIIDAYEMYQYYSTYY